MSISFTDFMTRLAQGQLKNTAAVDDQQMGVIVPEFEEQILTLTNQGLVDITTRKKLFEEVVVLPLVEGQNVYPLDTSAGGDYENFVRVIEIVTKDERKHLPKTSSHITQPNPETLRLSSTFIKWYGPAVDVRFQTNHPVVDIMGNIQLPTHLIEPLLLYVAGLYLSHMGGEEHTAKGDSYYGLYLKMMTDDTMENSSGTSEVTDEDTRFQDRGFV